jgi:hypothetical protein
MEHTYTDVLVKAVLLGNNFLQGSRSSTLSIELSTVGVFSHDGLEVVLKTAHVGN